GVRPPAVSLEEGLRRVKRCSRRAMSSTSRGLLSREVDIDAAAAAGLAWESTMHPTSVRTKRWTRLEYERLIELGGFQPGERIELVGGQLIVREPQGTPHSTGIRLVAHALRAAFGPGFTVEAQLPLALDEESEPEPDVAVVAGGPRDF